MTEWLAQYERVAQRQQEYLKKIQDLRQQLRSRERHMLLTIEHMRSHPRYHSLTQYSYDNLGKKTFTEPLQAWPSQTFNPKFTLFASGAPKAGPDSLLKGSYPCMVAGERLLPKIIPNKATPVTSRRHQKSNPAHNISVADMTLERNKTDYEPIEEIAKRNRIHFSYYPKSREGKGTTSETADSKGGYKERRSMALCPL